MARRLADTVPGVALRAWAASLGDAQEVGSAAVAEGAAAALRAITDLGGAKVGDKTLVDAMAPFVERLRAEVQAGRRLAEAWSKAAQDANTAAEATARLRPRLGRARPLAERSLGHRDAGAVSLALCARVIGDVLSVRTPRG